MSRARAGRAAPSAPKVNSVKGGPDANEMTVSWTPPKSVGGRAVTGYLYDVQVDSAGPWSGPFTINGVVMSGPAYTTAANTCHLGAETESNKPL